MQPPPIPKNESQRLRDLQALGILDTPSEQEFDDIVRMAALTCNTEFAAVSLVDADRQWFKAAEGNLGATETPRSISVCGYTILGSELFEITDLSQDARFADNPLVTQKPNLQFYAGIPLIISSGTAIGSLCALGQRPNKLSAAQREQLALLAKQVVKLIEARQAKQLQVQLGMFIERSNFMVALLDLDAGLLTYANSAWRSRCGTFPGDDLALVRSMFPDLDSRVFEPQPMESEFQVSSSEERLVRFSATDTTQLNVRLYPDKARSDGNHHHQLIVVIEAEADRSAMRRQVRSANERINVLEQVAQITQNSVIITNGQQEIEWVNAAFEKLSGYGLQEIIGRNPSEFVQGPDTDPEAKRNIRQALDAGQPIKQEILNYSRAGKRYWVELDIQPVRDLEGNLSHFVAVQTDITRRKQQEADFKLARDEAERASRLKSQFLANISHELRTPLNAILGISEYLRDSVSEEFREDLTILHRSGKHLLNLLNEMIDLSAMEAGILRLRNQPMCVQSLLWEVVDLFEANALAKGLTLELELFEEAVGADIWVLGDATRLRQVLMNLVSNAIKFTQQGKVVLYCAASIPSPEQVTLQFSVRDTGPGINSAEQQKMFRRFEHGDSPEAGAGLGLSICQEILRHMHTQLDVQSLQSKGSNFQFDLILPRASKEPREMPIGESNNKATAVVQSPKILLLDDNPTNLKVMTGLLEKLGISDITVATSGREALNAWKGLNPDLVLVDILMPEMDGYQFVHLYRAQLRAAGVKVMPHFVACTALDSREDHERIIAAGFDNYLQKPVSFKDLVQLISEGELWLTGPVDQSQTAPVPQSVITPSLIEKMAGNTKLINSFLELLVKHYPEYWQRLERAQADGDREALANCVHTLKGQLGYFGAENSVYQQAVALDQLLKQPETSLPEAQIANFCRAIQGLIDQIRSELGAKVAVPKH